MRTIFYDDPLDESAEPIPSSIFLAGPTAANVHRTPWRAEALAWLDARAFEGTVIVPELRSGLFDEMAPRVFGGEANAVSPVAGMRLVSYNILRWETSGIERSTVVLFWMPFHLAAKDDPKSLPGFTTRAEVARELARDPKRIVLGMPKTAISSGHIRFHAHRAGVVVASTLEATLEAAYARASKA